MKNNRKTPGSKTVNYNSVDFPEVISMDSLSYFDDENLDRLHGHLQSDREKASRHTEDLLPWEVEICYVQREMKIRSARRIAHEKYIRNNPDAYYENTSFSGHEDYDHNNN